MRYVKILERYPELGEPDLLALQELAGEENKVKALKALARNLQAQQEQTLRRESNQVILFRSQGGYEALRMLLSNLEEVVNEMAKIEEEARNGTK